MLTCDKCEKIIARYLVGTLPPWSRKAVARHLDACSPCLKIVESHYQVAVLMEKIPSDDPPSDLWNRVVSEIGEEPPGYAPVPAARRDWRPGVIVAAAGLTAGIFLGQALNSPGVEQASTFATVESAPPQIAQYVQHHSRMAGNNPLADQVSLAAYETAAFRDTEQLDGGIDTSR